MHARIAHPAAYCFALAYAAASLFAPRVARADPPAATAHRAEAPLPQGCEQDPFHVDYGAIREGSLVRLGRHRSVEGNANWDPSMEHFVGRVTPVVSARGLDPQGCPILEVAVDGGEYVWRVRDMSVVDQGSTREHSRVPEIAVAPGIVRDPRVYSVGLGALTRRAASVSTGCAGWVGAQPTLTLLLQDDFATLTLMARATADTVLLVRTPGGEYVCVDDVEGRDPVLTGHAVAGRYEVYLGAYAPSDREITARFALSERSTIRTTALDAVAPADLLSLDDTTNAGVRTRLQAGRPVAAPASGSPSAPPPTRTPRSEPLVRPSSNTR